MLLEILVRHGADVNNLDEYGRPLLWNACVHGKVNLARFLLSKGARITGNRNGRFWCAVWWCFMGVRSGYVAEVIINHLRRDLTALLPPEECDMEVFNIRNPMVLAIALEMGADPAEARPRNSYQIPYMLREWDLRFQVARWRRLVDETRRLQDTPLRTNARTRTGARVTLNPACYLANRVATFKALPMVEVTRKAGRSVEGQVLEFVLTGMSAEVFKTLVDDWFALV